MTNRIKTRILFLVMAILALILNSVVDMYPKGLVLNDIASKNISYITTRFMIDFYGYNIRINDDFNSITRLYGVTKDDIEFTVNNDCRLIKIKNKKLKLKTKKRTLEILNNKVNGMGKQLFGITKQNIDYIMVDKEGYFTTAPSTKEE